MTQEERDRFRQLQEARTRNILDLPLKNLFEIKEPQGKMPNNARIMDSVTCESCGEGVMETRTRRFMGKTVCIPCFNEMDQR